MGKEYDKLVRDKIPDMIRADGHTPYTHIAVGSELKQALWTKLDEEYVELRCAEPANAPGELADLLEVLDALTTCHSNNGRLITSETQEMKDAIFAVYLAANHYGVSNKALDELRERKAQGRGTFSLGIILERVE